MNTARVYQVNFVTRELTPIETDTKNNLPVGTVLRLNGYDNPDYVIVKNLGVNERFPGYGTRYITVDLETLAQVEKHSHQLKFISEKRDDRIQTYITGVILSENEVRAIWEKSERARLDREEKALQATDERARLVEIGKALFAKHIPETAQAVIVAHCNVDESDMMTDYHGHTTTETVILGYSKHKRDLFGEMRKAAVTIPETKHLGPGCGHFEARVVLSDDIKDSGYYYCRGQYSHWHKELDGKNNVFTTRQEAEDFIREKGAPGSIGFGDTVVDFEWTIIDESIEHREKYSMGAGYYLKDGWRDSTGWMVNKVCKYGDNWGEDLYIAMAKRNVFETA